MLFVVVCCWVCVVCWSLVNVRCVLMLCDVVCRALSDVRCALRAALLFVGRCEVRVCCFGV